MLVPLDPWRDDVFVMNDPEAFGYAVFERAYDEEIAAESLNTPAERHRRRGLLDACLKEAGADVRSIRRRFELALGVERLSSAAVALLIDNSGSMRGGYPHTGDCAQDSPAMLAACAADILTAALEGMGVKIEILGFTTVDWKGGKPRKDWAVLDKPRNPGRLNAVRHIVYKTVDSFGVTGRKSLGVMLDASLLKENIDGEALVWAHGRLMACPETRRILIVISDGASVDDSTLTENAGDYLERHLRYVIRDIETRSSVELIAIGVGYDVTRYYRRALTITGPSELAGAMTDKLIELFEERGGRGGGFQS